MIREHIQIDTRHGSPYDRGMADSYYQRGRSPHYFKGDSYNSPRVTYKDMTPDEVVAYHAGYDDNEESGDYKDWG
jgi:hypothetical protein